MIVFYALALAMLALAVWPLVVVVWRPSSTPDRQPASSTNITLLREQRAQLDAELAEGKISPTEHTQAQTELARRVLQESASTQRIEPTSPRSATALALLVAVPVLAVGLYLYLGEPDVVRYEAELAKAQGEVSSKDLDAMVRQVAQKLQSHPPGQTEDAPAWAMLARAHASRQRFADADQAYQRALELTPDNPDLLADLADLLSSLQGQSASGESMRQIGRAHV